MKWLFPLLGWFVFLASTAFFIAGYNSRWEFGRYYMPATRVTEAGCHPDGAPCDPFTLALVRADIEEEAELSALAVVAVLLTMLIREMAALHRMQMRHLTFMAEINLKSTENRQ